MTTAPITEAVWVTREQTTIRHLRGLLQELERRGALDYAQVHIKIVSEEAALAFPGVGILTVENLPAEGLVWIADDEGPPD